MLTMKNTGLVQGVPLEGTPMVKVKVLRGFYDQQGRSRNPGELVDCSKAFANSLLAQHKAELVSGGVEVVSVEATPTPPPDTIEPQPEPLMIEPGADPTEAPQPPSDKPRRRANRS